jgi:hypothetical protein
MVRAVFLTAFVALAVFYYYFLGTGPTPSDFMDLPWWRPRGWVLRWESLAPLWALADEPGPLRLAPVALFALPPLALMGMGMALFRSAVMRVLLLALGAALAAFSFYGQLAPGIWGFFSWRWPAMTFCMTLVLASLLLAPSLLRSALRLPILGRAAVLAAVAIVVYLASVEITGTNWELRANLSPWPVITMFGFLLFGYLAVVIHAAVGLGTLLRTRLAGPMSVSAGILLAAVLSGAAAGFIFSAPGLPALVVVGLCGALGAALVLARQSEPGETLARGWSQLSAAALVFVLIFVSDRAASRDLATARNEVAPVVLDALAAFREATDAYPDELQDLVPDYLAEVPRPRVGPIRHDGERFLYTNLGDSYLLEFACTKWVQCAYSPPYDAPWGGEAEPDEEDRDDLGAAPDVAAGGDWAGGLLEGSWSCDPGLPRLW